MLSFLNFSFCWSKLRPKLRVLRLRSVRRILSKSYQCLKLWTQRVTVILLVWKSHKELTRRLVWRIVMLPRWTNSPLMNDRAICSGYPPPLRICLKQYASGYFLYLAARDFLRTLLGVAVVCFLGEVHSWSLLPDAAESPECDGGPGKYTRWPGEEVAAILQRNMGTVNSPNDIRNGMLHCFYGCWC